MSNLQRFKDNGSGVLVYLRDGAAGVPPAPLGPISSCEDDRNRQWREIDVGAQILGDLKITSIRHLTSSTHHFKELSAFGIEIVLRDLLTAIDNALCDMSRDSIARQQQKLALIGLHRTIFPDAPAFSSAEVMR